LSFMCIMNVTFSKPTDAPFGGVLPHSKILRSYFYTQEVALEDLTYVNSMYHT